MTARTGPITDPENRRRRAAIAGAASQTTDGLITRVVRRASELTPEHIERLRALLPPAEDEKASQT